MLRLRPEHMEVPRDFSRVTQSVSPCCNALYLPLWHQGTLGDASRDAWSGVVCSSPNKSTWAGITCVEDRVTEIKLVGYNLHGSLHRAAVCILRRYNCL